MDSATSNVNSAIVSLRSHLIHGQYARNADQVRHALYAMNEILPDDLRVVCDSDQYNKAVKSEYKIRCKECDTENMITKHKIKIRPIKMSLGTQWQNVEFAKMSNTPTEYILCDECKSQILLFDDDMVMVKKSEFADRYVPAEPELSSVFDISVNQQNFWNWVTIFHATLERQMKLFRDKFTQRDEL